MGSLSSAVVSLLSLTVLFGYVIMEMEARELSPADYWNSIMHNQPIPKSIAELLLINEEFSPSPSPSTANSTIKHMKKLIQPPAPAPAATAASNVTVLDTRRFSRTFDTSPNVIIYHSNVIIN